MASFSLGILLIFSAPYGKGIFKDWLIPLLGSYRISLFDALAIPIICIALIVYGIRIKKYEQFIFFSLILIIASRILSLLAAERMELEQVVSVFRYIETLLLIYTFTNLLANPNNRHLFIRGVIIGVMIETVGGLFMFLSAKGMARGILISTTSFILQVFIVIACLLDIVKGRRRVLSLLCITIIILAILFTLTRTAWIFLIVSIGLTGLLLRGNILKPLLLTTVLGAISGFVITVMWPSAKESVIERINSALSGGGTVLYRAYLWDIALGTFLHHPITGVGSGGFARQQEDLPQIFGVELTPEYKQLDLQLSAHNAILGILSETGIVGLFAYFLWATAVVGICLKVLRSMTPKPDKYITAAAISVIALIFSDFWTQGSFYPISSAFIALLMGWRRENSGMWRKKCIK